MSLATTFSEASETRRRLRAQRRIEQEHRPAKLSLLQFVGWSTYVGWVLATTAAVPLLTWLDPTAQDGTFGVRSLWRLLAMFAVLVFSGHLFQRSALSFSPQQVLFLPSKAGLVAYRVGQQAPRILLLGCCWSLALWLRLGEASATSPVAAGLLFATLALAPFVWQLSALGRRLSNVESGFWVRLIMLAALSVGIVDGATSRMTPATAAQLGICSALALPIVVSMIVTLWRNPGSVWRGMPWEALELPRYAFAMSFLAPASWLQDAAVLWWCALLAPLPLLVVLLVTPRLLRLLRDAEEATPCFDSVAALASQQTRANAVVPLPRQHSGRASLWRAQWAGIRHGWFAHGRWPRPIRWLVVSLRIVQASLPALGISAMIWMQMTSRQQPLALSMTMLPMLGLVAPALITVRPSSHLWRLGVDYREQLRHNMRAIVYCAALPVLLFVTAFALFSDNTERFPQLVAAGLMPVVDHAGAWLLVIAGLAACFLLRLGWHGLVGIERTRSASVVTVTGLLVIVVAFAGVPALQWWTVALVGAAGAIGLWRVCSWQEQDLVAVFQAEEERVAVDGFA